MKEVFSKITTWCNKHEWTIFLLVLVILLRLPSLFVPHYYGDEEIYFVMGRAWRLGFSQLGMYAAAFDHKPPLIYIVAGITQSMFWFRAFLAIWMLGHTFIVARIADIFWGKTRPILAKLTTIIFVLLTSWPLLEGNVANAELFMMMPLSAALLVLLRTKEDELHKYFVAGLLAGVGLLFKVPVMFDFIALVIYFMAFDKKTFGLGAKSLIKPQFWMMIVGFLIPILMTVINYQLRGAGTEYIRAAILVNFGYVSSWKTSSFDFNPLKSGLVIRGILLAGYTLVLYLSRKLIDKKLSLILLWLGFSIFGSLLSARPYPHYLLQPIVPMAFLIPYIFAIESVIGWSWIAAVITSGVVIQNVIGFWGYPTISLYRDFFQYATKKISWEAYRDRFSSTKMNYAVAEYLLERMTPDENIYVWGNDVTIYNLLDKPLTGGKYMVDFHVRDWQAFSEVIENLNINKPEYIVVLPNSVEFTSLEELLRTTYIQINEIEEAQIYHLIEQ